MVIASERLRLATDRGREHLLLALRPPPGIAPGVPILCPYVDNCNAFVWDNIDAEQYLIHITDMLTEFGLAHRVESPGRPRFVALRLDVTLWRPRLSLLRAPYRFVFTFGK